MFYRTEPAIHLEKKVIFETFEIEFNQWDIPLNEILDQIQSIIGYVDPALCKVDFELDYDSDYNDERIILFQLTMPIGIESDEDYMRRVANETINHRVWEEDKKRWEENHNAEVEAKERALFETLRQKYGDS